MGKNRAQEKKKLSSREKEGNTHRDDARDPPLTPVQVRLVLVGPHPERPAQLGSEDVPAPRTVNGEAPGLRVETSGHIRPTGKKTLTHRVEAKAKTRAQKYAQTLILSTPLRCRLTRIRRHLISTRISHLQCIPMAILTPSTSPTITTGHTTNLLPLLTHIIRQVYPRALHQMYP